jgi:phosphonate transport system ATP-binding protein
MTCTGTGAMTDAVAGAAPAIVVDDVTVGYDGRAAVLHAVSFAVPAGAWWAVVGPSGCGKTTLLRAILGVLRPSAGTVRLPGRRMSRAALGYIPQQLGLVRNLTARQNTLLGGLGRLGPWRSIMGRFTAAEVAAAEIALEAVGLGGRGDTPVTALSGGERRRVAIARALVQRPRVLLADEFLAELDPVTSRSIVDVLGRLRAETGMTILCVEHDLHAAAQAADRVVVLVGGRKVREVDTSRLDADDADTLFRPMALA